MKQISVILLVVTFAATGCKKEISKNIDQDKIFTQYELFYDQTENVTYATATFKFSSNYGTKLMLSDPSTITLDGTEMDWDNENGYYQNQFDGFKSTATFHWVDLDGNSFTNTIDIRDIALPTTIANLHFADSVTYFMWNGSALDSSENVTLTIDGVGETDRRDFRLDTVGATTFTLDSVQLSQIDSGMVQLFLNLRYSPALTEQTSRGGSITGRYQTVTAETLLTD
ncbi:MAG: hypothetical protein K9G46_13870 [Flavobacteriales bacterium]|nr:hypothetical protein [Flavobacteriales bacterium]